MWARGLCGAKQACGIQNLAHSHPRGTPARPAEFLRQQALLARKIVILLLNTNNFFLVLTSVFLGLHPKVRFFFAMCLSFSVFSFCRVQDRLRWLRSPTARNANARRTAKSR